MGGNTVVGRTFSAVKSVFSPSDQAEQSGLSGFAQDFGAGLDKLATDLEAKDPTSQPPAADAGDEAAKKERRPQGRAATILTGGRGLEDVPYKGARRVLLGR